MYLDEDIFNILYNEGLTNNLDIIKFNGLQVRGLISFSYIKFHFNKTKFYLNIFIIYLIY
jgi:hypothetical protein